MNIIEPHATTYEQGTDPIVDQIVNNLRQVYDPEIHLNIYDLGLISVSYTHLTLPTILRV